MGEREKKKNMALTWHLYSFFLLCNTLVEMLLLRAEYATPVAAAHNKEISAGRPSDNSV
jgi:hypothetical protein